MRLEDTIDKETYDRKYLDLSSQIEQLQKECESLQDAAETETTMRKRVAMFRQTLEQNEVLDTFDRHIFESIVEKVIVGGYDSDGNKDPYMIVFVYKTGFKNSVDGKNFKPLRKNSKENHSPAVLCSHASNEAESMCSDSSDDTYRNGMRIVQTGYPRQKAVRETLKLFYRESKKWCDIQTAYLRYAMQRCCIIAVCVFNAQATAANCISQISRFDRHYF